MVSGQFFILPFFLGAQFNEFITCLALLSLLIIATCPSHISLFLLLMQPSITTLM